MSASVSFAVSEYLLYIYTQKRNKNIKKKFPSQNITVQYKYLSQKKKAQHPHHPKHETNNPW